MKFLIILSLVLLAGCATQRNAEKFYNKHPDKLVAHATRLFPNVDSTGTPFVADHVPANNIDYSKQIDSLEQEAQRAKELVDSLLNVPHTPGAPEPVADGNKAKLQKQVGELLSQVKQLRANYKPCESDTAKIIQPIYRELGYKLADLRCQLGDEVKKREKVERHLQEAVVDGKTWKAQRNKLLWILFVIAGGVGVWLFFKLKPRIPISRK